MTQGFWQKTDPAHPAIRRQAYIGEILTGLEESGRSKGLPKNHWPMISPLLELLPALQYMTRLPTTRR